MKFVLLYIIAMLTLGWMWALLLEQLDWKLKQRRMWKQIQKRLE